MSIQLPGNTRIPQSDKDHILGNRTTGQPEPQLTRQKLEPVVRSQVKQVKKSAGRKFVETFLTEDVPATIKQIGIQIVVPTLKNLILESIGSLMGVKVPKSGIFGQGGVKTPYGQISTGGAKLVPNVAPKQNGLYAFDALEFEERGDALALLNHMCDILDQAGYVTVADVYDLTGLQASHTDVRYGWKNLGKGDVARTRDGFKLILPNPIALQ